MKNGSGRLAATGIIFGLFCGVTVAQPVVSLEARAINGVPIPGGPSASIMVEPGDQLEVIFRLRDWSITPTTRLKGYQMSYDYDSGFNGTGSIEPLDYDLHTDTCNDCVGAAIGEVPDCPMPGDGGQDGLLVDTDDPTFPYICGTVFTTLDANSCDYRWAGAVLQNNCAPLSVVGMRYYVSTLFAEVSANASGTFILKAQTDPNNGVLLRDQTETAILPIAFEHLTVTVTGGGPNPGPIVSSNPPNNAIDARQPSTLAMNCADTPGFISIILTHQNAAAGVTPASYSVTLEPAGGPVPMITGAIPNGNMVAITLNQTIPPGRWTRITHIATGSSTRVGYLPGDVNNDRTAGPTDVLRLIDRLNNVCAPPPPPCQYAEYQTDADRSGITNPADILRVIDLLNGAGCFDAWNGMMLLP